MGHFLDVDEEDTTTTEKGVQAEQAISHKQYSYTRERTTGVPNSKDGTLSGPDK